MGTSGPVNVELPMLFQSTWNLYTVRALRKFQVDRKKAGRPAGGVPTCRRALLGVSVKSPAHVERDHLHRRGPGVHLHLVERPDPDALEGPARGEGEQVGGHVDAVRPDAQLRIVVQCVGELDR
jgi:hypothetical protein